MATNTQKCLTYRFVLPVVLCEDQPEVPPYDPFDPTPEEPEED